MKLINWKMEPFIWLTLIIPFAYLGYIWNELPEQVPMHYNINGEADRYGPATELFIPLGLLVLLPYLLFLIVPIIDPKRRIEAMGSRYHQLKLMMAVSMSLLATFIVYYSAHPNEGLNGWLFAALGLLYAGIGNFMPSMKPNYFLGIRTPWTLESETVWKRTHRLSGRIWLAGGLLIIATSLLLPTEWATNLFIGITVVCIGWPIIQSYRFFKEEEKEASDA